LFPGTIITVRVSGLHPESGIRTVTVCSPSVRLTVIGVTLFIGMPSTTTAAPEGNDVTLSEPFAAAAVTATATRPTRTAELIIPCLAALGVTGRPPVRWKPKA
jgi:hypothetical protein